MKFVIVDYRQIHIQRKFSEMGFKVIPFTAEGLVYPAIDGHPDIFIFFFQHNFIISPNIPKHIINFFVKNNIPYQFGKKTVGYDYPETVPYNAYVDNEVAIIHPYIDESIKDFLYNKEIIEVKQGYVRCNVFRIGKSFVTSDVQIHHALIQKGFESHYVLPTNIVLPGVKHGFIGGCFGEDKKRIYFAGNAGFPYFLLFEKLASSTQKTLILLGQHGTYDVGGLLIFSD
jgi:hypothetical protein